MKKIIDDKLYDTEKATLIFTDTLNRKQRDYYVTNKGTYFCHYVSVGNIEIVAEREVKELLAERDIEKFLKLYPDVEEG